MTESTSSSNKRIAKNTMMLYIRMLLTMAVTLYTSRVVLNTLGVEDFGIYNVVGGFVTMFAFLNNAMATATQRFLSFEIGRKNFIHLRNVFNMSVNIHFIISFVILLLAETIGLWFLNTQLTIPPDRIVAAQWVYHFSVLTMMVNIVSVPYNAIIIAHERMNVFAGVSIAEVSLKLLIVFMLQWLGFDKLKLYAVLMFSVALIIRLIYGVYCKYKFRESRFRFYWENTLFKTLMSYAGWNLWGSSSLVIKGQGVNVLLNIFFGPSINAARAIAFQVSSALEHFVNNFQMAIRPQVIKSYAQSNLNHVHQLIYKGSKYSFMLLFILSLPILLETEIILIIWLKTVPSHTIIFTRLIIINALIESFSGSLATGAQASGRIKLYQGVVGVLFILNLPISYLCLRQGHSAQITFYVSIIISIITLFARLKILSSLIKLDIHNYLKNVVLKSMTVVLFSIATPLVLYINMDKSLLRLIIIGVVSIVSTLIAVYLVGLDKEEQKFVNRKIVNVIN